MKARIENGILIYYYSVPEQMTNGVIGTTIGGYDKLSSEIHKLDGFYDVVVPDYDTRLQELGEIYFDDQNEIYTYPIIDKNLDLATEKNKKIQELKNKAFEKFSETDWYYIRNMRIGAHIPDDVQANSDLLYFNINKMEAEINNLDNILDVLNYEINL